MKSAPTHRPLTPSQARQNAVEKQKIEGGSVVSSHGDAVRTESKMLEKLSEIEILFEKGQLTRLLMA